MHCTNQIIKQTIPYSKGLVCDYFTSMGVKNYYSAGYEPWQDGWAEASIKSTIMLAKCGIADSGLGAPFWFSAAPNGKDCRNATYNHRIRSQVSPERDIVRITFSSVWMILNAFRAIVAGWDSN